MGAGQSGHTCGPPRPTPPPPPPCLQGDARSISYEDSKYLGGDVAHTHLVKGLDFALLQKVGVGVVGLGSAGPVKQGRAGAAIGTACLSSTGQLKATDAMCGDAYPPC